MGSDSFGEARTGWAIITSSRPDDQESREIKGDGRVMVRAHASMIASSGTDSMDFVSCMCSLYLSDSNIYRARFRNIKINLTNTLIASTQLWSKPVEAC